VTKGVNVDYKPLLKRHIIDFIHKVQVTFMYGDIIDDSGLKKNPAINLQGMSNVLEVLSFVPNGSTFSCKVKVKGFEDIKDSEFEFNENTNPIQFELKEQQISK
jgi:hypothetical protein